MTTAYRAGHRDEQQDGDEGQDMDAHFYSDGTHFEGTLAEVLTLITAWAAGCFGPGAGEPR